MVTTSADLRHRLKDRVALVIGASRGIGAATAMRMAQEGAAVVLASRDAERLENVQRTITDGGGLALAVEADASRDEDIERVVAITLDVFERLDIAFNNAGIQGPAAPLHEQSFDTWDQILGTNLRGVFACMRAEIRAMNANGGGAIINNASVGALVAAPGIGPYCASKHGVIGLTKSAALDYAHVPIRINAIAPGAVDTDIFNQWMNDPADRAAMAARHPIGRIASADEISGAVAWLASDDASFTTGTVITIDGGYTAA